MVLCLWWPMVVDRSLNVIAEPEGNSVEEIVYAREREGVDVPGRLLEGLGAGRHDIEGGGISADYDSETKEKGRGVWDRCGSGGWGNVEPNDIRDGS